MQQWLKGRMAEELDGSTQRRGDDAAAMVVPALARHGITEHDVLFGKASDTVDHVGNIRFRNLIDRFMPLYEASSRREKTGIADNVIRMVRDENGRFIKLIAGSNGVSDQWDEVNHTVARQKTAHTFRNRKKFLST